MGFTDNKDWDLIQKVIQAEASGRSPHLFSSQRTLFGIPSELDKELASFASENVHGDSSPAAPSQDEIAVQTTPAGSSVPAGSRIASPATSRAVARTSDASRATAHREPTVVEHPLQPVFDDESRVLILGTMPSPRSRETGFYYNHPQNRFWLVMAQIFNEDVPTTNDEKRALVLAHHVALWDVLASCQIEGAKDISIAQCIPNDISLITREAPIRAIFCTGAKATELYERYCKEQTGIECTRLPSTSPANAACSLEQLVQAYRQIVPFTEG